MFGVVLKTKLKAKVVQVVSEFTSRQLTDNIILFIIIQHFFLI
jgi:hypothetical protein